MNYDKNVELDSKVRYTTKGTKKVVLENVNGIGFDLGGNINIIQSELGTIPSLAIAGVDIFDYSNATTYNTIGTHNLSTETHVIVDHPDSDGAIILQLPEISTLTGTKKYKIQIKGSLKNADTIASLRSVTLLGAIKTGDATKGDSFDGHGEVVTTNYIGNFHIYFTHGTIEIQSVIGGYTGGTTNGWAILSSHFDKDKSRKDPVRLASTANVVIATALIDSQTIDGVTLKEHDKVLLKDQSNASQNGVYRVAGIGGEPTRDYQWQKGLYSHGWETKVSEGTAHAGKSFSVTSAKSSSLIGTDDLTVSEFGATVVPGGSNTEIQFNNSGVFGGSSALTWDGSSLQTPNIVSPDVSTDIDVFSNMTSGSINLGAGLTTGDLKMGEASTTGDLILGNASQSGKIHILNATDSSSVSTGSLVVDGGLGLAKKLFAVDHIHIKADNKRLYCGASDDVELFHTGTNSILNSNTGDMQITSSAGSQIYALSGGGCKIFGQFANVDIQANTADVNIGNDFTSNVNIEVQPDGGGNIIMGSTLTSGNINLGNASQTGKIHILNTTDSGSGTAGALVVDGGLGVAKKLYVGDDIEVSGNLTLSANTPKIDTTHATGDFSLQSHPNVNMRLGTLTTTGDIIIGQAQTSGNLNLGNASGTGIVDIASELRLSNKGTVTQITSATTGVTLNKPLGVITTVSLVTASDGRETFTVTNSYADATSIIIADIIEWSGVDNVSVSVSARASGSFTITIFNNGGSSLGAVAKIAFVIL